MQSSDIQHPPGTGRSVSRTFQAFCADRTAIQDPSYDQGATIQQNTEDHGDDMQRILFDPGAVGYRTLACIKSPPLQGRSMLRPCGSPVRNRHLLSTESAMCTIQGNAGFPCGTVQDTPYSPGFPVRTPPTPPGSRRAARPIQKHAGFTHGMIPKRLCSPHFSAGPPPPSPVQGEGGIRRFLVQYRSSWLPYTDSYDLFSPPLRGGDSGEGDLDEPERCGMFA